MSPYCDIYGGLVLNATINLYAYCTIEETEDDCITICSYDADVNKSYPLSAELEIDGEASLIKGVYNRVVKDFGIQPSAFRITTYNDAPAGSGLGTSSTMVVCILKAFVNDSLPELIFAQQVNGYGKPHDVFLGISTSGNSRNVLYAAVVAKAKGLKVIGLTGQKPNRLAQLADVCIRVPATETYKIQELHLPVYHCLCLMLEEHFFGNQQS